MVEEKSVLFITGMPRSGTKLLRDILNNHSQISIPSSESLIIPILLKTYANVDLKEPVKLREVVSRIRRSKFAKSLESANGVYDPMDRLTVYDRVSIEMIIEDMLRHFGKPGDHLLIGDKTPGYILHSSLLFERFPNGKLIHIIRDPRDQACSVRHAWGRNIFRAADRWNRALEDEESRHDPRYLSVRYEGLIRHPDDELKRILTFLDLPMQERLLEFRQATENLGHAAGFKTIKGDNAQRYREKLTSFELERIEQIAYHTMIRLGYTPDLATESKPLAGYEYLYYRWKDAYASLLFHVKEKGLVPGLRYFIRLHRENSVRNILE